MTFLTDTAEQGLSPLGLATDIIWNSAVCIETKSAERFQSREGVHYFSGVKQTEPSVFQKTERF